MSDATAGTSDYWGWSSLREIDRAAGRAKGSAFRTFKRRLPELVEGRDFVVLDHRRNDGIAARWQAADRLYRGSINPVLLAPATAARVAAAVIAEDAR